ncbi:MAG: DUF3343 domain-containing protein [Oscillospiraceae bacterium]|jgi:hypothetical protein|nr:DUF3343 domain-containing protein [Oscillospiraceae bacterium]
MAEYIATFHTHLAALKTYRTLTQMQLPARMAPVPRRLSSSCGVCVMYTAEQPFLDAMDKDVEAVYQQDGSKDVRLLERD